MKRKELQRILSQLKPLRPKIKFEQYATPADVAATLLWYAYMDGNIAGRSVADLGCGNGILAIGAKLLGAERVIGIDIDEDAIKTARKNAAQLGLEVDFLCMDIGDFNEKVDTVVMNPPFGIQSKYKDVDFLIKAFQVAEFVYSIHKSGSDEFIFRFAQGKARAYKLTQELFSIPATFDFHKRKVFRIDVSLWKFEVIR